MSIGAATAAHSLSSHRPRGAAERAATGTGLCAAAPRRTRPRNSAARLRLPKRIHAACVRPFRSLSPGRTGQAPAPNGKPHHHTTGHSRSPAPIPLPAKGHRGATAYGGRAASAGRQREEESPGRNREGAASSTAAAQGKKFWNNFFFSLWLREVPVLARLSFDRARSPRQAPDRRSPGASGGRRMEPYAAAKGGGADAGTGLGLEESMRRLGLGEDGEAGEEKLPERPGEADCAYYLRTGACGYGERCRYNHPRDRPAPVNGVGKTAGMVEYPERPGQPLCEYYAKNGTCKFGSNCKFDHPREGGFVPVTLNSSGFPLRLGEKECSYYMKTGHCKFGATCKFHHPELGFLTETPGMYPPVQPSPISSSHPYPHLANWQMGRPPVVPGSFLPGSYPPMMLPPTVMPMQGWNPYVSPMNQVTPAGGQQAVPAGASYGLSHQGPTSAVTYASHYAQLYSSSGTSSSNIQEYAFPERPGQPECEHYMKTGTCKYGAACKYHHPQYFSGPKSNCILSPLGLPLRPGSQPCAYYAHHGFCKFGPTCKFDHPMGTPNYSISASSLIDVPVAPYPHSFPVTPMPPYLSSSDLRPQYTLVKDSSANPPPAPGTTYGPVGSISKVYAPHTLIRSPASAAAGMQAS